MVASIPGILPQTVIKKCVNLTIDLLSTVETHSISIIPHTMNSLRHNISILLGI